MISVPDRIPELPKTFPGVARAKLWHAGEAEAARRLKRFVTQSLASYDRDRDMPALDGTSTLSPYLAAGVISPRRCLQAALRANEGRLTFGKKGAVAWIGELVWREFYRHVLQGFPRICMNRAFKLQTDMLPWSHDEAKFTAWCEGRTGVPIVDAGMRQLAQTGWMHNRLRMITAMFLTKDLFIDWRWGERHFMQHLVDGDFANNNGGWQWSASTGTDAVPYFRVFNPYNQSRRFDPRGVFIRRFVPELAAMNEVDIHEPLSHGGGSLFSDYPPPIIDRSGTRARILKVFSRR